MILIIFKLVKKMEKKLNIKRKLNIKQPPKK